MLNKIAEFRKEAGLSQMDLATSLNVTQGTISNYETGYRDPGLNECRAIVKALNAAGIACGLDDVFPRTDAIIENVLVAWKELDIAMCNGLDELQGDKEKSRIYLDNALTASHKLIVELNDALIRYQ